MSAEETKAKVDFILNELATARFSVIGAKLIVVDSIVALQQLRSNSQDLDLALRVVTNNKVTLEDGIQELLRAHEYVSNYRVRL
jgi:hypothetical protein